MRTASITSYAKKKLQDLQIFLKYSKMDPNMAHMHKCIQDDDDDAAND